MTKTGANSDEHFNLCLNFECTYLKAAQWLQAVSAVATSSGAEQFAADVSGVPLEAAAEASEAAGSQALAAVAGFLVAGSECSPLQLHQGGS